MKFRIETPGFKASPSLKTFAKEKVGALVRFYKDIQEIEVTLEFEVKGAKEIVTCTLNVRVPGKDEYVKAKSSIFEDSILKAVEKAKRRLRIRKTQRQAIKIRKTPNRRISAKVARKEM